MVQLYFGLLQSAVGAVTLPSLDASQMLTVAASEELRFDFNLSSTHSTQLSVPWPGLVL